MYIADNERVRQPELHVVFHIYLSVINKIILVDGKANSNGQRKRHMIDEPRVFR